MSTARAALTATRLGDGRVLVVGGEFDSAHASTAELYDPGSGRWERAGTMTAGREAANATLLGNGRVLLAGGGRPSATRSAGLYDPASRRWSATGSMTDYHGGAAALLQDGHVLVAGGRKVKYCGQYSCDEPLAEAELYTP